MAARYRCLARGTASSPTQTPLGVGPLTDASRLRIPLAFLYAMAQRSTVIA